MEDLQPILHSKVNTESVCCWCPRCKQDYMDNVPTEQLALLLDNGIVVRPCTACFINLAWKQGRLQAASNKSR